jgi:hypothetical protein
MGNSNFQTATFLACKYSAPGNMMSSTGATEHPYTQGCPCSSCPGNCDSSGKICKAGTTPTRCQDGITTFWFNEIRCTDCDCLIGESSSWCTKFEDEYPVCQLTCGKCEVPTGIRLEFCNVEDELQASITRTIATVTDTTPTSSPNCGSPRCQVVLVGRRWVYKP